MDFGIRLGQVVSAEYCTFTSVFFVLGELQCLMAQQLLSVKTCRKPGGKNFGFR